MPYEKLSEEEIKQNLSSELEARLDTTDEPGELVTKQLEAEAATLAKNQEEALERVSRAAYLADASGEDLDKVVDIIGLNRRGSTSATGVVKLWRETPPKSQYTIPKGTEVQTGGTDPIVYEITQLGALRHIEGFENGTLDDWNGDVSSFPVENTTALTEDYALKIPSTANQSITTEADHFKLGSTFSFELACSTGASLGFRFGLQDQSNYYEAEIDQGSQDLHLRLVEDGSESAVSSNNAAEIPTSDVYVEATWGIYDDSSVEIYASKQRETLLCSVSLDEDTGWTAGALSLSSLTGDSTSLVDEITTRAVHLNIEAVDTGTETNVGPKTISETTSTVAGVEEVLNPVATGKPDVLNTEGTPLVLGEERETDEELRDRAYTSTSIGGAATAKAIDAELWKIDGVKSVTLNRNRESETVDGLPPSSFEAVVYGGSDKDIGRTIFETASIDSHDVGGVNGVKASYTVTSQVTNGTEEISWSRPERLNLDIELDLVVGENYVGENEIRSIVTEYIGGTDLDGSFINGLNIGDDIYQAVLSRKLVAPDETGVWEVNDTSIDKSGDGTDDITTTSSGAEVLEVGENEVAITNARNGSITITTTQK